MDFPLIYMFYYFLFILLICTPQLIKNFEVINTLKKKLNYDIVHKFNTNDYYSIANITNSLITNNQNKKFILFYWNNNYLRKSYSN